MIKKVAHDSKSTLEKVTQTLRNTYDYEFILNWI